MVDFQSRDTRRGLGDDGDDDDETEPDADAETTADDATDDTSTADEESARADDPVDEVPAEEVADPLEPDRTGGQGHGDGGDHSHGGANDHSHDHGHGLDVELLGVAVVTVSSTRSLENDPSGDVVQAVVEGDDHEVVTRELIRDEFDGVQSTVKALVGRDDVDAVVLTGGTGVTPDDVTVEAVETLFDKELPGFGELFRLLSYEEVGTKVVATRATAGIVDGVPVFALPGSENAAHLGTEEVILPEVEHLVGLAGRDD